MIPQHTYRGLHSKQAFDAHRSVAHRVRQYLFPPEPNLTLSRTRDGTGPSLGQPLLSPTVFVLVPGTPAVIIVRMVAFSAGYLSMLFAPIRPAFGVDVFPPGLQAAVDLILLTVLLLDVLCGFFAAYYNPTAELEVSLPVIRRHYATHKFPVRLLALLPLRDTLLFLQAPALAVSVGSLLPLVHIWRWIVLVREKESSLRSTKSFTLVAMSLLGLQIVHWLTCCWWYLEQVCARVYGPYRTWAQVHAHTNLWDLDQFEAQPLARYFYIFQFVFTLILDPLSKAKLVNPLELAGAQVITILGVLMIHSYLAVAIAHLTNRLAAKAKKEYELKSCVEYLLTQGVSPEACRRYMEYHEQLWFVQNGAARPWALFNDIPDTIRAEISLNMLGQLLRSVAMFAHCPEPLLRMLATRADQLYFAPGEAIIRKDDVGAEMYIVRKGQAQVVSDDQTRVWADIKVGGFFGELSIFNPIKRTATVVASTRCHLLALSRTALVEAQAAFPVECEVIRAAAEAKLTQLTQWHNELRVNPHMTSELQFKSVSMVAKSDALPSVDSNMDVMDLMAIANPAAAAIFVPVPRSARRQSIYVAGNGSNSTSMSRRSSNMMPARSSSITSPSGEGAADSYTPGPVIFGGPARAAVHLNGHRRDDDMRKALFTARPSAPRPRATSTMSPAPSSTSSSSSESALPLNPLLDLRLPPSLTNSSAGGDTAGPPSSSSSQRRTSGSSGVQHRVARRPSASAGQINEMASRAASQMNEPDGG
ncbi:hypothetical protein BC828DRAFT_216848 [Blastocladiella britannica]|nr:hypothetical protein BC828DRAFT_216848 [Blastocladiella britannica]